MALLFFLSFLLLELAIFAWLGDVLLRLARYRSLLRQVPEFCVLLGLPVFALAGYALFIFSNSAICILPGVVALGVAAEFALRRRSPGVQMAGPVDSYRRFGRTPTGMLCWAILAVAAVVVLIARIGWLTGRTGDNAVEIGTRIYDDMRTVGFPISLAAFGYPLHNPLATETALMYPLGAFIYPTAMVAILPSLALPVIVADTVVGALIFGMVMMLFAAHFLQPPSERWRSVLAVVFALSCVFSVAFDWGSVPLLRHASFFPVLFGYFKEGINTTVGSTTLVGLVWVESHALAFLALATAALLFSHVPLLITIVLAAFGAASSMDMTMFGLAAAAIWILFARRTSGEWPWRFMLVCLVAAGITGLIMAPGLTGKMDGLQPRGPSFLLQGLGPLGAVLSTEGLYLLILAIAIPFAAARSALVPFYAAVAAPVLVLLAFHYGSFWFWRGHFALHALFSMLCMAVIASIPSASRRNVAIVVWALALLPGIYHSWQDIKWFRIASAQTTPAKAEAIRWVYRNTRLEDRVVGWKPSESSLAPTVDYLRAGSRAGKNVYDRYHVVIGYKRNLELMSDLLRGIAANDYIIYEKDDPSFEKILVLCHAPVVFQNAASAVYHVDEKCRAQLDSPPVVEAHSKGTDLRLRAEDQLKLLKDPMQAAPELFAVYLGAHPTEAGMLARRRADSLWSEKKFADAVTMLNLAAEQLPTVAEIQYSLAFSKQQLGLHQEAVACFTRALELGYAEFWGRYGRGSSYAAIGNKAKATEDLQRAMQLDPAQPGPKIVLGTLK